MSMCDGTDDPNQTGTTPNRTRWDNPSRTGTTQPSGTTQPNWDSPAKWDSPGRAGTTQPAGPSQSELRHSKDRLSQSGPGRPSPLGRPTQTWSGPIFSPLLRCPIGSPPGSDRGHPRPPKSPIHFKYQKNRTVTCLNLITHTKRKTKSARQKAARSGPERRLRF